jgi:hypothetical protein
MWDSSLIIPAKWKSLCKYEGKASNNIEWHCSKYRVLSFGIKEGKIRKSSLFKVFHYFLKNTRNKNRNALLLRNGSLFTEIS